MPHPLTVVNPKLTLRRNKGSCEMEVFKRGTGFGLSSAERHLAREKRAISQEMFTGRMPVPRDFATPSTSGGTKRNILPVHRV
jgi:hypothetical protein